ncbi:unnamed protein product [Mytilus coruscus]|uniref:G-protein coupled receptors family 1 profile domain-containing protein n=1 Tax=Mytilus coruscus TaxID=42192 RepID=A0A6J8DZR7_MYTCO|nr:unnamed protein product [Mytilus coruscus]
MGHKYVDDFVVDKDKYLLEVFKAGSVLSYVSMLFNIVVFVILFRKRFLSPATILMQSLAAADLLTAFSCYGLEPMFQSQYRCELAYNNDFLDLCYLPYPYCSMAHHLMVLSFTFHSMSYMITTCLGIQKVIAIIFPIWTKHQLTKKKVVVCCVIIFFVSIAISIPRHFSIWADHDGYPGMCYFYAKGGALPEYSSVYYLMIQTVLVTFCCLIMLMSSVFIIYKLINNNLRYRMTRQRLKERRSVIMVVLVLVLFLITEIPKVIMYQYWCYNTIGNKMMYIGLRKNEFSSWLLQRYGDAMAWLLTFPSDMILSHFDNTYIFFIFLLEGIQLFTIVGCMSNFIIYIVMSTKLRNEVILVFKKMCNCCLHKGETNKTNITENIHTKEKQRYHTQSTENRSKYEKDMNRVQETGPSYKNEIEIHPIQGNHFAYEIEGNKVQGTIKRHTYEIAMMQLGEYRHSKDREINPREETEEINIIEVEINPIEETGRNNKNEIKMIQKEGFADDLENETEVDPIEETENPVANVIEINSFKGIDRHRKDIEKEMNPIQEKGYHRTKEIEMTAIEGAGDHRSNEIEMNVIHGNSRTDEIYD